MTAGELQIVTGAFGYTGQYIARRLVAAGCRVRTLTNSVHRANAFGGRVEATPFHFDDPDRLEESLRGAAVLYNTYWVRFNRAGFSHTIAVENTRKLISSARRAGLRRFVHVSITNPSEESDLEYFRGKAMLERTLQSSGISYGILRPAVIFGNEDILINNIAWILRRFPVFGVFGDGRYRLQPIFVDDLAKLAVELGQGQDNEIVDAIGPETFTYRELVCAIGAAVGRPRPMISLPPWLGYTIGTIVGRLQGDVLITRPEIEGLMRGLLCTDSPPAGETRFSDWVKKHAARLGTHYASELSRRRNRFETYEKL